MNSVAQHLAATADPILAAPAADQAPPASPRRMALWGALALTLATSAGLAWWAPEEDGDTVLASARPRSGPPPNAPAATAATGVPAHASPDQPSVRQTSSPPAASLPAQPTAETPAAPARSPWPAAPAAALAAWGQAPAAPPPAPTPAAAEGPPPVPKFPYSFIGRLDDGAEPTSASTTGTAAIASTVLLGGTQRSLGVRVGDVLDGQWRVDRITRSALHLTWLPTGQATQLSLR